MRARWYDPELGRFISEDPLGVEGGINQYVFVDNDPINGKDPSGLWTEYCSYTTYRLYINGRLVDQWRVEDWCRLLPDPGDLEALARFDMRNMAFPQRKSAEQIAKLDLCKIVPSSPPGANISANIYEACRNPYEVFWFKSKVRNNGPWDYKRRGMQYEDFGNFNYGATGTSLGLSKSILLIGAGYYQQRYGDKFSVKGNWLGNQPYGDQPKDQVWIRLGISYAESGAMHKCK